MIQRQPVSTSMVAAVLFVLASVSGSCTHGPGIEEPAHGESILDRTEHVEPALLTDIPATFRWCDRIEGLDKRRIDAGGAELYVEAEGKGTPLVLINGGPGGTHHYFHPWFSRARRFAKIVYYDQRGCGLSDFTPGKQGYSVEQAAGDLDAVRRALGIEKWVVLGYSYGGFLAQLYTVEESPRHVRGRHAKVEVSSVRSLSHQKAPGGKRPAPPWPVTRCAGPAPDRCAPPATRATPWRRSPPGQGRR